MFWKVTGKREWLNGVLEKLQISGTRPTTQTIKEMFAILTLSFLSENITVLTSCAP